MEIKTCEEYVLQELSNNQKEVELCHKRIYELEDKLAKALVAPNDNEKCPEGDKENHVCYHFRNLSSSLYENRIPSEYLKEEVLNKALNDDDYIKTFINISIKHDDYSFCTHVGEVSSLQYQYEINKNGHKVGINIFDNYSFIYDLKTTYYETEEECYKELVKEVRKNIKSYMTTHADDPFLKSFKPYRETILSPVTVKAVSNDL